GRRSCAGSAAATALARPPPPPPPAAAAGRHPGEPAPRRRIGAQDARAKRQARCPRPAQERGALLLGKPALRADQHRKLRTVSARGAKIRTQIHAQICPQRRDRIATWRLLVAEY